MGKVPTEKRVCGGKSKETVLSRYLSYLSTWIIEVLLVEKHPFTKNIGTKLKSLLKTKRAGVPEHERVGSSSPMLGVQITQKLNL